MTATVTPAHLDRLSAVAIPLLMLAVGALAVPSGAPAVAIPAPLSADPEAQASACRVSFRAATNRPRAGRGWRWSITVSPARTTRISMAYVFAGQVVGRPSPSSATFRGTYRKTYTYPRRAVGIPLTFRVIVRASGCARTIRYRVRARA